MKILVSGLGPIGRHLFRNLIALGEKGTGPIILEFWGEHFTGDYHTGHRVWFPLTYRSSWNLGIAAALVNVVASLILVPVAIFVFKDKISWINILGIFVCLAGLVMLNWKR